jgi:hypothetical protein
MSEDMGVVGRRSSAVRFRTGRRNTHHDRVAWIARQPRGRVKRGRIFGPNLAGRVRCGVGRIRALGERGLDVSGRGGVVGAGAEGRSAVGRGRGTGGELEVVMIGNVVVEHLRPVITQIILKDAHLARSPLLSPTHILRSSLRQVVRPRWHIRCGQLLLCLLVQVSSRLRAHGAVHCFAEGGAEVAGRRS